MWKPEEIIINEQVKNDPVTQHLLNQCPGIPVRHVDSGTQEAIKQASNCLKNANSDMLSTILAGKKVVYLAPAGSAVDVFMMPDSRMKCPEFDKITFASNGCYFQCDWCYLKLTYRAARPFIMIRTQYDLIKKQILKRLNQTNDPVMFNCGEMADSLALEHLTNTGQEFIPWFGQTKNGYLFMLTKSDNVDNILDVDHNGHTFIAWSMNNAHVSRKYEVGAPTFERRLNAAHRVQQAGYPVRIRLDPIVPFDGWQDAYADTIDRIFEKISPDRITLGTLRFEKQFYNMRHSIFTTGDDLPNFLEEMTPMFTPKKVTVNGKVKTKAGKYSFSDSKRVDIFKFAINRIREHSNCKIALCKESAGVWNQVGLDLSKCGCVCQYDTVDMT